MSYHVLIVDDDPAICKLLSKVMVSNEMEPLVVNSGAAALDLIARQSNTLDMILMDITSLAPPGQFPFCACRKCFDLAALGGASSDRCHWETAKTPPVAEK